MLRSLEVVGKGARTEQSYAAQTVTVVFDPPTPSTPTPHLYALKPLASTRRTEELAPDCLEQLPSLYILHYSRPRSTVLHDRWHHDDVHPEPTAHGLPAVNVNGLPAVNVNGLPARRLRGAAAAKHATKPIDGCGPVHVHTKPIDGCPL